MEANSAQKRRGRKRKQQSNEGGSTPFTLRNDETSINFYSKMMNFSIMWDLFLLINNRPLDIWITKISLITTGVYFISYMIVTHFQRERINGGSISVLGPLRFEMGVPQHVKFVVTVITVVKILSPFLSSRLMAWFLVNSLQLSSCYFFYSSDFIRLIP